MPTLERIPATPLADSTPATPPENHHGQPPPDEFSRMMQEALTAKPKDSPRLAALRAEKNNLPPAAKSASPENSPATSAAKKIAGRDPTAAAGGKIEKAAANVSADQSVCPTDSALLPVLDLPVPPAVLVPLPAQWVPGGASASPSTSTKNTSAIPAVTTAVLIIDGQGDVAAAAKNLKADQAAEKSNPPAAELASAKIAARSSSQIIEPVKKTAATDAEALLKNVATAADKNSPVAEIPKPATNENPAPETSELASAALAPATENDGTGVATVDMPMKKSANTNKVAGLAGTVLPGDGSLTAAAAKVLPTLTSAAVRMTEGGSADSNFNQPVPAAVATVDFSTAPATAAVPAFMEARMRNLERTHDMVALHAVRLVESQTDTLSVVIKPGAGTELSLQLRQRDGGVEAHAVLQRGDFQLMNQHWPELQQRLEQRGVKLAPLGSETNFTADNGSGFKQQQQASQEAEAQKASAFAEFALAGSRALGATARLAVGVGGWESWA